MQNPGAVETNFAMYQQKARDIARSSVLRADQDPYTAAFALGHVAALERDEGYANSIKSYIDMHKELSEDVEPELREKRMANFLLQTHKTFQHIEYPYYPSSIVRWRQKIGKVATNQAYEQEFGANIFLPVMATVPDRSVMVKLVADLYGKREGLTILDPACGLNHGLRRLVLESDANVGQQVTFPNMHVMRWGDPEKRRAVMDYAATYLVNRALHDEPLGISRAIGMDIVPFERDKSMRDRAESDSRYMGETMMHKQETLREILASERPGRLKFINADASAFDLNTLRGDRPDIVFHSTWMYAADDQDVTRAIANSEAVVKDDGLIIVQDFVKDFPLHGTPTFYNHTDWLKTPWLYSTWVKDMSRPELGFRLHFTLKSGRAEAVVAESAALELERAQQLGLTAYDAAA